MNFAGSIGISLHGLWAGAPVLCQSLTRCLWETPLCKRPHPTLRPRSTVLTVARPQRLTPWPLSLRLLWAWGSRAPACLSGFCSTVGPLGVKCKASDSTPVTKSILPPAGGGADSCEPASGSGVGGGDTKEGGVGTASHSFSCGSNFPVLYWLPDLFLSMWLLVEAENSAAWP